jgi:GntR family transcriptional regulator of arabinose operon
MPFPSFSIDSDSTVPKYQQLLERLERLIVTGEVDANTRLPSENELFDTLKISRSTIRRAFLELESRGLVYRRQGQGTFVGNRLLSPTAPAASVRPAKRSPGNGPVQVLLPTLSNEIYPEIVRGIEEVAHEHGCDVSTLTSWSDPDRERELLERLRDSPGRGLILEPARSGSAEDRQRLIAPLQRLGRPVVLIDDPFPEFDAPSILLDDFRAGREACRHFLDLGHRRLAVFFKEGIAAGEERMLGFQHEAQEAGVGASVAVRTYREADEPSLPGYRMTQELVASAHRPTALFCFNDDLALQCHRAATDAGLSLPRDLSLLGFDNIRWSRMSPYGLSTFDHPKDLMGRWAADLLFSLLGNAERAASVLIRPKLVVRTSTCPPPF